MSVGAPLRLVSWVAALGLVALPIVGVVNGWFAADRWPFRQLKIDAEFTRVSAEQVRAAVAASLERGFFAVDLDEVRREVEQLPWIEAAEVRKRWPDLIEVRVVERRAVAVWGDRRLVSARAELFRVPGGSAPAGLPQLAGPDTRVAEVLDFYRDTQTALGGTGMQVEAATLSGRGSWMLTLASGGQIVIGREAPAARLQRFIEALPRIEPIANAQFERVDLRYANGFAVHWRPQAPPVPPSDDPAVDPSVEPPATPVPEPADPPAEAVPPGPEDLASAESAPHETMVGVGA